MKKKPKTIFFIISFILILFTSIFFISKIHSETSDHMKPLLVINCDSNIIKIPLGEPLNLTYSWTHSVEGTPIVEEYSVTPMGLTLTLVKSQSFGAGHPYSAEELGGNYTVENGYLIYTANYYIGKSLEILGNPSYNGTIIIEKPKENQRITCINFIHATIEVVP